MTRLGKIIISGFLMAAPMSAMAENIFETMSFRGIATSEVAVALSDVELQKWDFTLLPEITMDLSDTIQLTAIGLARLEATDNLEPDRANQSMRGALSQRGYIGDIVELELREFYIDTSLGNGYLRLGKQQIVWGQADGLRVLDVVNPFNFREFILDDFEDRRIPLWSVNLEVPLHEVTAQFIWIPDQTYDQFPKAGATYAIRSPRFIPTPPPGSPVILVEADKPNRFFADSDVGLRLSAFTGGWDLTLSYLYHYQDRAVLFQHQQGNNILIEPDYKRSHLLGATFSNAFGSLTLRGEIGYSTDKYFQGPGGPQRSDELSYVLGLDYSGIEDSFISVQFFQSILTHYRHDIARDKVDNQMTLLLERNFMNDTLKASFLLIQSLNDGDGAAQFDLDYDYQDNIIFKIGADIFYGTPTGLFGQFSRTDRLTIAIEFSY